MPQYKQNILVIDDTLLSAWMLVESLKQHYDVSCVSSKKKIIEKIKKCFGSDEGIKPNLVVLDYHMYPGQNGDDLAEQIRKSDSEVPIAFYTSDDRELQKLKQKFSKDTHMAFFLKGDILNIINYADQILQH